MGLDNFESLFSPEDLIPIVPTATEVTISATIIPTCASITPTCATIKPFNAPAGISGLDEKCPLCLGCGQFFDLPEELKTHQLNRYNCTIYTADLRRKREGEESWCTRMSQPVLFLSPLLSLSLSLPTASALCSLLQLQCVTVTVTVTVTVRYSYSYSALQLQWQWQLPGCYGTAAPHCLPVDFAAACMQWQQCSSHIVGAMCCWYLIRRHPVRRSISKQQERSPSHHHGGNNSYMYVMHRNSLHTCYGWSLLGTATSCSCSCTATPSRARMTSKLRFPRITTIYTWLEKHKNSAHMKK